MVAEDFDNYGCQIVVCRAKMLLRGEWLDLPGDPIYVEDIARLHHDVKKKQAKWEVCIAKLIQQSAVGSKIRQMIITLLFWEVVFKLLHCCDTWLPWLE